MKANTRLNQWISKLDLKAWDQMSAADRLGLLQEFENTMAELEGRDALPVKVVPAAYLKEAEKSGGVLQGYFSPSENEICINPKFLEKRKSILGVSAFSLPKVLETIAHEGRHAWQQYVVDHPEKKLVDRNTRLAFQMNCRCYCSSGDENVPFSCYQAQLIELDARRFAKDVLIHVSSEIEKRDGHPDLQFVTAIRKSVMRERLLATTLINSVLEDDLMQYEEAARKVMSASCPGVDFSKVSMFGDAITLLRTRDVSRFTDDAAIEPALDHGKVKDAGPAMKVKEPESRYRDYKKHRFR